MTSIGSLIVVLGVLIFVHELGHFLAAKAAGTHKCKKKHVVWMTETGVGAPHAGQDKRTTAPAERRACLAAPRHAVPILGLLAVLAGCTPGRN